MIMQISVSPLASAFIADAKDLVHAHANLHLLRPHLIADRPPRPVYAHAELLFTFCEHVSLLTDLNDTVYAHADLLFTFCERVSLLTDPKDAGRTAARASDGAVRAAMLVGQLLRSFPGDLDADRRAVAVRFFMQQFVRLYQDRYAAACPVHVVHRANHLRCSGDWLAVR